METELPELFRRRRATAPHERYTFHSSRMRMREVSAESLREMDADSDRCAVELSDAQCEVMAYACLVAIMAQGPGTHNASERRLVEVTRTEGCDIPVLSSAGALLRGLDALGARRISIVTPYVPSLTAKVVEYIEDAGVAVHDAVSLGVADNCAVGRLDPAQLIPIAEGLGRTGCDAIVLSACVQMPSLPVVAEVERRLGLPVISAAIATTFDILRALGRSTVVADAGHLLSDEMGRRMAPIAG
jgi:maleate isomerase